MGLVNLAWKCKPKTFGLPYFKCTRLREGRESAAIYARLLLSVVA